MLVAAMLLAASPRMAQAEALLLIEADTGKVLRAKTPPIRGIRPPSPRS